MQLTISAVHEALADNNNHIRNTRKALREVGYRFDNAKFTEYVNTEPPEYGYIEAPDKRRTVLPKGRRTLVFTCAQNNTDIHLPFWRSLLQYVTFRNAELHVSTFMYNKDAMAAKDSKVGTQDKSDQQEEWYDSRIVPYISDEAVQITDDLVWCGELNILPTRVDPLSTMSNYTRQASGIIPHVKMRMLSVPTMKDDPAKLMYTTGTVTKRNYIQRVAGQVAEFHHVFGALVVEVDEDGNWWARQLNADAEGNFYDLDTLWTNNGPTDGIRVQAVTHGDLHGLKIDEEIFESVFCEGGILDRLMPREQFFHDTIDFMPRNHHNIKDPHFLYEMHQHQSSNVEKEFTFAAGLLEQAHREWCKTFVVESNHDVAINQWLRNNSAFYDPENVEFWLDMNLRCIRCIKTYGRPRPFKWSLEKALSSTNVPVRVLAEDESYKILGVIEAALHGHLGPSGARGNPKNLRSAGKANTGHTHAAGIIDGIYTAGVYGKLDMGYNKGLSAWSHSLIVTYPNTKRTILTIRNGKAWRDV